MNILYYFSATWCAPCKMMSPIVQEVMEGKDIELVKVDIEDTPEMVRKYNVRSVPTFVLVRDDVVYGTKIGSCSKEQFDKWIKGALEE